MKLNIFIQEHSETRKALIEYLKEELSGKFKVEIDTRLRDGLYESPIPSKHHVYWIHPGLIHQVTTNLQNLKRDNPDSIIVVRNSIQHADAYRDLADLVEYDIISPKLIDLINLRFGGKR